MKRQLLFTVALALFTVTSHAQTAPPTAPPAPSQPVGTISGFSSSAVSGFTPNSVSGFNPNPIRGFNPNPVQGFSQDPVSGFTPVPRFSLAPSDIDPLTTRMGNLGTNGFVPAPVNPNRIVVPPTPFQSGVRTFPPNVGGVGTFPPNNTSAVPPTPLF